MSFKDIWFKKIFTLRNLFVWGNFILLILFLATIAVDQNRGWKEYPRKYRALEIDRAQRALAEAQTEQQKDLARRELKAARAIGVDIRQLWVKGLNRVDRCTTCHLGYDPIVNPSLTTSYPDHPYKASAANPSFDIHKIHNVEHYGCAECHGGQGFATETDVAHGYGHQWNEPLLRGVLLQASCLKCHDNLSELKIDGKIYPSDIIRAKKLFHTYGCIGCHQIGGEGGPISVDLQAETSVKPLTRIDFSKTGLDPADWTLPNWIRIHFIQDPAIAVPGDPKAEINTEPIPPSAMPPFYMRSRDADAMTAYILGLNRTKIPYQFLTLRPAASEPVYRSPLKRGRWVFEKYGCAGCHGAEARGGIRNFNYLYDVTPNLRKVVQTYTRAHLKEKIQQGVPIVAKNDPRGPVPPLYMPAWKDKIKGRELDDLVTYLFSIKE